MSRRVEAEWHKQGLPRDTTIAQYFGMVEPTYWYGWVGRGKFEPIPGVLDQGILEDHGGGHVITRD